MKASSFFFLVSSKTTPSEVYLAVLLKEVPAVQHRTRLLTSKDIWVPGEHPQKAGMPWFYL
jgi:hypothetical protein